MTAESVQLEPQTLDEFQNLVLGECLSPLWMAPERGIAEPRTPIQPYLWRWEHLRKRIGEAGELIPLGAEAAERRVLTLRNPGLPAGRVGTTQTLVAAIQLVQGSEVAPSHRHTMAALRFIKEGRGACTVVNGEPESMEVGDLLLTPSWYWHGHFSEHDEPMVWLDGLDVPLVLGLGATFQEDFPSPDKNQPYTVARDESIRRFAGGTLLPVDEKQGSRVSPLMNYRWAHTEERLMALANHDGSPHDGIALRFTNPLSGGSVMPTIDCWIQLLRQGERTKAHRHTGSVVYTVVRGAGYSVINGQRFDWAEGDVFCIPSWALHEHANNSASADAILFSFNDSPVLSALGLYREAPYEDGGGYQQIHSIFPRPRAESLGSLS